MKRIGLIYEQETPNKHTASIKEWLEQRHIVIENSLITSKSSTVVDSSQSVDCAVVILTKATSDCDNCRDIIRELRRQQRPIYILGHRNEIQERDFSIPFHLRDLCFFDLDYDGVATSLEWYLANSQIPHPNSEVIFEFPSSGSEMNLVNTQRPHPITDVQNLRRAWLKAWKNARTDATYYDELSYELYHRNIDANLVILSNKLQENTFELQHLFCISVPKVSPESVAETGSVPETRELYFALPETAIVLQAVCDLIGEQIEDILDLDDDLDSEGRTRVVYSNRLILRSQDTESIFYHWRESHAKFRGAIKNFAFENPETHFFRTDIRKYYPSINTSFLRQQLSTIIDDEILIGLLDQFLDLQAVDYLGEQVRIPGIPAGIPLSHLLGNFYLHPIDQLMSSASLQYFRYVDDIIFFDQSPDDLLNLRSLFINELSEFGESGLSAYLPTDNPQKSFVGSSADIDKLDAAIDNLSPLLRIDFNEFPEGSQRQKLGDFIHSALVAIDNVGEDHSDEVYAKYAALAVYKLKELEYRENLSEIVYRFLQRAPLRSRTIRWLIEYLVERVIDNPDELSRFIHFLRDPFTTHYIILAFFQSLRGYQTLPEHIWQLVDNFEEYDAGLISGECLYIKSCYRRRMSNEQNTVLFGKIESNRSGYYVIRAYWYLFSIQASVDHLIRASAFLLNTGVPEYQKLVFSALSSWQNGKIHAAIFSELQTSKILPIIALPVFSYWVGVFIGLNNSKRSRTQIIEILKVQINQLNAQARGDLLASTLGDILTHDEVSTIQTPILSVQQARLLLEEEVKSDTDIYYFSKYRKIAEHLRLVNPYRHDHLSISVEWDNNRVGFIEIIRHKLIESKGFADTSDWIRYLRELDMHDVCVLVDIIDLHNGNLAVIYEVPPTHRPLSDLFNQTDHLPYFELGDTFAVLSNLNSSAARTLKKTQTGTFLFSTIHSELVLVSDDLDISFVCIGASLDNTPRYLVAEKHTQMGHTGIEDASAGFEAYSLFLGYLLIEILTGEDPVFLRQNLPKKQYLSEIEILDHFSSHVKGLIARSANSISEFRYKDYEAISIDLNHIQQYFQYLDQHRDALSEDELFTLELVDYMRLRLGTHKRNPELAGKHPEKRVIELLNTISKDFTRFAPRDTSKRDWLLSKYLGTNAEELFPKQVLDWCSIASKKLLRVYAFWSQIIEAYKALPDIQDHFDIRIFLEALGTFVIVTERTAYIQLLARLAGSKYEKRDVQPEDLERAQYILSEMPIEDQRLTHFKFSSEDCQIVTYSVDEVFLDVRRFKAAKRLGLTAPAILFAFSMSRSLAIFDNQKQLIWHSRMDELEPDDLRKVEWHLSTGFLMQVYFERLHSLFPMALSSDPFPIDGDGKPLAFYTDLDSLPTDFDVHAGQRLLTPILDGIRECHSSKRTIGKILTYKPQAFDESEGHLKLDGEAPRAFYDYDLIEREKTISLPPDGAAATVDLYRVDGQGNSTIGAIIVEQANLLEIFTTTHLDYQEGHSNNMRDQIFISYAHKDKAFLDELLEHLSPLVRHDVIAEPWSDKLIDTGEDWESSIQVALSRAKLVILLVSPSFMASKFIAEKELVPVYEAHGKDELIIWPIAIRHSSYDVDPYLKKIQFANSPQKPIAKFKDSDRDEEWVTIAKKLADSFNK